MLQDYRYERAREALLKGLIKTFSEIVEILPKTRIAETTGSNNDRVTWCIDHPWHFTVQELMLLSDALEINTSILHDLAEKQCRVTGNEKNKRRMLYRRKKNNKKR